MLIQYKNKEIQIDQSDYNKFLNKPRLNWSYATDNTLTNTSLIGFYNEILKYYEWHYVILAHLICGLTPLTPNKSTLKVVHKDGNKLNLTKANLQVCQTTKTALA